MFVRRLLIKISHQAHRDHREIFLNFLSVISVGLVVDFAFVIHNLIDYIR
jgi:hypothetical protein